MRTQSKSTSLNANRDDVGTIFQGTFAQNLTLVDVAPAQSGRVKQALLVWAAAQTNASSKATNPPARAAAAGATADGNISTRHAFNTHNDALSDKSWRAINPLVSMQVLHDDGETLSWYARFQPGGRLPAHDHTGDEESLVISGSCYLNDKLMQIGDYQICRAGSRHDNVFSEHGCLLFIRTPKAMLRQHAQHG